MIKNLTFLICPEKFLINVIFSFQQDYINLVVFKNYAQAVSYRKFTREKIIISVKYITKSFV